MIIYGLGAFLIFFIFTLLYFYALRNKEALQLNAFEIFQTRSKINENIISGLIPLGSVLIAATGIGGHKNFALSGMFYWSYAILLPLYFSLYYTRKRKKLFPETM